MDDKPDLKRATAQLENAAGGVVDEHRKTLDLVQKKMTDVGLLPTCAETISPIMLFLGYWAGRNIQHGVPVNLAIAEIIEASGSTIETLLEDCDDDCERVHAMLLKANMNALELCCKPGTVTDVAAALLQMVNDSLVANAPLPS